MQPCALKYLVIYTKRCMCKYRGDEQKKAYETETKHKICMSRQLEYKAITYTYEPIGMQ